jgi:hypothetical protein
MFLARRRKARCSAAEQLPQAPVPQQHSLKVSLRGAGLGNDEPAEGSPLRATPAASGREREREARPAREHRACSRGEGGLVDAEPVCRRAERCRLPHGGIGIVALAERLDRPGEPRADLRQPRRLASIEREEKV